MMDTGFFRWVWRFNALAIALVAMGALVLMAVLLAELASDAFGAVSTRDVLAIPQGEGNPAAPSALDEQLFLGALMRIEGTGLLRGNVLARQTYEYGLSSKETFSNTLNIHYVDPALGTQRWLFPSGRRLILDTTDIDRTERMDGRSQKRVLASLFLVISEDTSGDGRLSVSDTGTLMIAAADGSDLRTLAEGVSGAPQTGEIGEGEEYVLISQADGKHLLRIDLATRTVLGDMKLELPQGKE